MHKTQQKQGCTLGKCKQRVTSLFARLWVVAWRPRAAGGVSDVVCTGADGLCAQVRQIILRINLSSIREHQPAGCPCWDAS
eukprot:1155955-Pelagomonas_calceolata.AAC.6